MAKIEDMADLKKLYREHYTAARDPEIVDVPQRPHLMIDGEGDPNTSQMYAEAVASIYPLAYGLRKAIKDATGEAYTVMPLEGLWWVPDMSDFTIDDKSGWLWTSVICLPDAVTPEMAAAVLPTVTEIKKLPLGSIARVEQFGDGLAAQIMHHGPYADEAPTIERLHDFIETEGYNLTGKHHEIYLTDPRRSAPEKNRTIIRQPIAP
ncbi:MAG: GyrI-like domain-containing protein [Acidimicrobiia bacterium]|nr:GyrI-like domain-containing protein [Acidimicrobiia bacterium]